MANPHAPLGGGLQELHCSSVMDALRSMSAPSGRLQIAHLSGWMTHAAVVRP